jgi:hypothetical protein
VSYFYFPLPKVRVWFCRYGFQACIPNPAMLDIMTKHADLEGKKFCDGTLWAWHSRSKLYWH